MARTVTPEYGSRAYWKLVIAQRSTKSDSAGRELVITGQGVAGPIYCTRQYASDCLYLLNTPALPTPNKRYTSDVTPYVVGEQDFHDGCKRTACPYSEENNPGPAAEWREGWDRAAYDDRDARRILGTAYS